MIVDSLPLDQWQAALPTRQDDRLPTLSGFDMQSARTFEPDVPAVFSTDPEQQIERLWWLTILWGLTGIFELPHDRDDVGRVTNVGNMLVEQILWLVLQDARHTWRNIMELPLQGKNVHKVCKGVDEQLSGNCSEDTYHPFPQVQT